MVTNYKQVLLIPLLWICFWLLPDAACAQQDTLKFQSIISGGVVIGQQGFGGVVDAAGGLGNQHFFAGVGIGYDSYGYHSLPLYVSTRYYPEFIPHGFGFGKLGYNVGLRNKVDWQLGSFEEQDFSGGLYAGAGLGFSEKISKNTSMFFSVGYSLKKMKVTLSNPSTCENCSSNSNIYHHEYRRIVFRAGILF